MGKSTRNAVLVVVYSYLALNCVLACGDRCGNWGSHEYGHGASPPPEGAVAPPPLPLPPRGNGHGQAQAQAQAPRARGGTCPVDILELGVCTPLLGILGKPSHDCCALLGVLGVDVDICLCLALDLNVLGLIDIPLPHLDLIASILTKCGLPHPPPNFSCPST